MKRFRKLTQLLALGVLLVLPAIYLTPSLAGAASFKEDACGGLNQVDSSTDANCGNLDTQSGGVNNLVRTIVTLLSILVGAAAVIMVVVSGFKYITSGGDANKIGSAKNTLIYALVGLAIAALAQLLVHFVLAQANDATDPCPTNSKILKSDPKCKP